MLEEASTYKWSARVLVGGLLGLLACVPVEDAEGPGGSKTVSQELASPQGVPSKLTHELKNVSGVTVDPASLRFLFPAPFHHDEHTTYSPRVLIGLQKNTDYFYVWVHKGQWNAYTLYCHGNLKDTAGLQVQVDSLKFALAADLDANGSSELIGLQADSSRMYAWELTACNNGVVGETGTSARYTPLLASRSGDLINWNGAPVPVNELAHVVSGHWTDTGSTDARPDQIRALHGNNAFNYVWGRNPAGSGWILEEDGFLLDVSNTAVPVNSIRYVFENRKDANNSNEGANKHELVTIAENGSNVRALVWENQETAVREFRLCKDGSAPCANKTLVFSLDQGSANGLVANADQPGFDAAFGQIIQALKRFQVANYHVVALLNPGIQSSLKGRLVKVLDKLRDEGIPFMFDIYSSDTNTMCTRQAGFSKCYLGFVGTDGVMGQGGPYSHVAMLKHPAGLTVDNRYVDFYQARYGALFEGLRIFEILSAEWGYWMECRANSETQAVFCPKDCPFFDIYRPAVTEEIVAYADSVDRYVFLTDNKWHNPYEHFLDWATCPLEGTNIPFPLSPRPIVEVRADVEEVACRHKQTIVLGFSNNEGVRTHDGYYPHNYRLKNWQTRVENMPFTKGFGLSNQTWSTDGHTMLFDETLPPEDLALWTADAFSKGATLVQLEPYWYLFQWDRMCDMSKNNGTYCTVTRDLETTPWSEAGKPTPELRRFAELMGVTLTN